MPSVSAAGIIHVVRPITLRLVVDRTPLPSRTSSARVVSDRTSSSLRTFILLIFVHSAGDVCTNNYARSDAGTGRRSIPQTTPYVLRSDRILFIRLLTTGDETEPHALPGRNRRRWNGNHLATRNLPIVTPRAHAHCPLRNCLGHGAVQRRMAQGW